MDDEAGGVCVCVCVWGGGGKWRNAWSPVLEWVIVMYLVDWELGSLMHCGLRVCVQQAIGEG